MAISYKKLWKLHMAILPGQRGLNVRPGRVIIGGQSET